MSQCFPGASAVARSRTSLSLAPRLRPCGPASGRAPKACHREARVHAHHAQRRHRQHPHTDTRGGGRAPSRSRVALDWGGFRVAPLESGWKGSPDRSLSWGERGVGGLPSGRPCAQVEPRLVTPIPRLAGTKCPSPVADGDFGMRGLKPQRGRCCLCPRCPRSPGNPWEKAECGQQLRTLLLLGRGPHDAQRPRL